MARVVVLYSTSGGGHLSAARALEEGLVRTGGGGLEVRLVDAVGRYSSRAVRLLPAVYSKVSRSPALWFAWYLLVAGPRRSRLVDAVTGRLCRRRSAALFTDHPADLYVSVHPALNGPVVAALRREGPAGARFATVVTDLVTMSPLWFCADADLCVVPTAEAARLALASGMPAERLRTAPYPVAESYFGADGDTSSRPEARAALGLADGARVVLVVGGAEGVGPIAQVVAALDAAATGLVVLAVCGRNTGLASRLAAGRWRNDVRVLGLAPDLVGLLRAADVVLTKAGPATLLEAAAVRVPTVVFHRLPGQEEGNVDHVVTAGAAVEAPTPADAAAAAVRLLDDEAAVQRMRHAQTRLAAPGASATVAGMLLGLVAPVAGPPLPVPLQRRRGVRRVRRLRGAAA